ncbi:Gypsy retrotransposon integrase-like protein 1 [Marasmius tenuissimus]|uniref:Gypsy retrotransposon integrase-like protein 1 n=1 Tax=Marasmius tenuissimus TaxID=585030 RepID=A0ABR2ZMJ3_9AGAR
MGRDVCMCLPSRRRDAVLPKGKLSVVNILHGPSTYISNSLRTSRGTKTVQSVAKSILSTSRPYVVPDNPEDTLRILKDLTRRVVDLEEQLEAFKKWEHDRQVFATTTPDLSVTNESFRIGTPMITHYTPAYTPTYMESENEGQVSGDETSTVNLVKAVVNQLAISTPAPAHPQTGELAQYLKEPDSTSDGNLTPCGNSMGRQSAKGLSVPARAKRKEFWDIHSWQLGTGNQDTSNLTYHGYMFPSDLLPTLVSLFFTNIHPFFPVLHKPIFERGVDKGLHHRDTSFASVLLMVCALGSRYSSDRQVLEDSSGIEGFSDSDCRHNDCPKLRISVGWKWFRQIRLIRTKFEAKALLYEL